MLEFEDLDAFLSEIMAKIDDPTVKPETIDGNLVIALPVAITGKPNKFFPLLNTYFKLCRKFDFGSYVKLVVADKVMILGTQIIEGWGAKWGLDSRVYLHVDMASFHKSRLKAYFKVGITKEEVKESVDFLFKNGWTSDRFQEEIGISSITVYRFHSGKDQKSAGKTEVLPQTEKIAELERPCSPEMPISG